MDIGAFQLPSWLVAFFQAPQTQTLLGLILLQVATGMLAALKTGQWSWSRTAEFYRTLVLPYIGGYLVFSLAVAFGFAQLPSVAPIVQQIADWVGATVAAANLLASIMSNIAELQAPPPPKTARAMPSDGNLRISTTPPPPSDALSMAVPDAAGPMNLTAEDLRQIKMTVIAAITSYPGQDVKRAFLAWLGEAGVLTLANFGAEFARNGAVYQRIKDTAFEADVAAEQHEAPHAAPMLTAVTVKLPDASATP